MEQPIICNNCGFQKNLEAGDSEIRFCPRCGQEIAPAAPPQNQERPEQTSSPDALPERFSDSVARINLEVRAMHGEVVNLRKNIAKEEFKNLGQRLQAVEARLTMLDANLQRWSERSKEKNQPNLLGLGANETILYIFLPLVMILILQGILLYTMISITR
jgi:DNA repair exonuclease SbcCD ATPase subunit